AGLVELVARGIEHRQVVVRLGELGIVAGQGLERRDGLVLATQPALGDGREEADPVPAGVLVARPRGRGKGRLDASLADQALVLLERGGREARVGTVEDGLAELRRRQGLRPGRKGEREPAEHAQEPGSGRKGRTARCYTRSHGGILAIAMNFHVPRRGAPASPYPETDKDPAAARRGPGRLGASRNSRTIRR